MNFKVVLGAALAGSLSVGSLTLASAAHAKGCIPGAIVGGIAGHYVGSGHGVIGAITGCWTGHYLANRHHNQPQANPTPQHVPPQPGYHQSNQYYQPQHRYQGQGGFYPAQQD